MLAFNKFSSLLDLLSICGVQSMPEDLYQNDKAAALFASYISESLCNTGIQNVKSSPFYGILVDESTNILVVEHLIVYASYMLDNEPRTSFLGFLEIMKRTAKGLENVLVTSLNNCGLDLLKLVSFKIDGASIMTR